MPSRKPLLARVVCRVDPVPIALVALLACPALATAQTWPTFVVRGGGLVADVGTTVRVDSTQGNIGTTIDLENVLGFKTLNTSYFVDGVWRISRRNQLQVDYEYVNRSQSRAILPEPITFGDTTFNVNAAIQSYFDSSYLSVYYGFAFVANPRVEFGASIGITLIGLRTGIGLSGQASGGQTVSRTLTENEDFTVPVPLPGVFFRVRAHPRVTVDAGARLLKVSVSDITASLVEARAGVDVRLAGPFGVGGSYYYNRANVERDASRTNGQIVYAFNGPQIYAVFIF